PAQRDVARRDVRAAARCSGAERRGPAADLEHALALADRRAALALDRVEHVLGRVRAGREIAGDEALDELRRLARAPPELAQQAGEVELPEALGEVSRL